MALWKEPAKSPSSDPAEALNLARFDKPVPDGSAAPAKPAAANTAPAPARSAAESLISPDLVIEGKIEGAGHVRIAGRFKGDINVHGDLTIENGAKVNGSVRAERVTVAGELTGNVENAMHVELLQSGSLTGDVKSKTFSVAKGSCMRGHAEFGWDDEKAGGAGVQKSNGHGNGQGK
jgi:cytoskeletal protein CcmA (bactofilin family)